MAFGAGYKKMTTPATNTGTGNDDTWANPWETTSLKVANDYPEIEPGIYPFRVKKWDPGRWDGNEKSAPCETLVMQLELELPDGQTAPMKHTIFLTNANKWKVSQLFEAVGAPVDGNGNVTIDWNELQGSEGKLEVERKKNNNTGKEFSSVKKFLKPER